MPELLRESWPFIVVALVAAILVAWWLFAGMRRTRVTFERDASSTEPARRNQALIDAPPAVVPPVTPEGLAGAGEAVAASIIATEREPAEKPASADDLTRIKGLGPKLAQTLADLGVTSFAQIAAWSDADIDRIDAQLGRFQGRIRRDNWPEQARFLAAGDTEGYKAKFGNL